MSVKPLPLPKPLPKPETPKSPRDIRENSTGEALGAMTEVEDDDTGMLTAIESQTILDDCLKKSRRHDKTIIAFMDSFIRCHNIKQASDEVGINSGLGYRIRHYKDVSLAIKKLIDKSAIKYGFDASEIMERTKELVDFDPIEIQNPDGSYKNNFHDMTPEARRSIKKMKCKNLWGESEDINGIKKKIIIGEIIEYEFYDKLKAIDLSGREKDMFKNTTKVEHSVSKDMASILLASAQRGDEAKRIVDADVIEVTANER